MSATVDRTATGLRSPSDAEGSSAPTRLRAGRVSRYRLWRTASRVLGKLLLWVVLINFAYVFLFPLMYMMTTSVKTLTEINNPSIVWISREPSLQAFRLASSIIDYFRGLWISTLISAAAVLGQTCVGAMVGYGFARPRFPGREFLFWILLFTIIVPLPTLAVPLYLFYSKLNLINTFVPLILPPFLGWGVRGGMILIVYRQFFRGLPSELEDAAYVDGASPFRVFWQIMLPLAKPAILVVMLFTLVWTWNDTLLPGLVINDTGAYTLGQRMENYAQLFAQARHSSAKTWSTSGEIGENVLMSVTLLGILPLLLVYIFTQRYFTQSIDRTGLVE